MTNGTNQSRRRALGAMGIVVAILAIVLIVALAGNVLDTTTSNQASTVDAGSIVLDLRAPGDVQIVATENSQIALETNVRDPLGLVVQHERLDDDVLTIESRCTDLWITFLNPCRVDYVLRVPASTAVSGRTSNADIQIVGLRAPIDIASSNGDMIVADVVAPVRLETDNGDVEVANVRGDVVVFTDNGDVAVGEVTATRTIEVATSNGGIAVSDTVGVLILHTDNGRIEVIDADAQTIDAETDNDSITMTLVNAPIEIVAETANGDIQISLPSGAPAYSVDAHADNGTTDTGSLVVDPNAPNRIEARTDNGVVLVDTR